MEQIEMNINTRANSDIDLLKEMMINAIDDIDFSASLVIEPLMNKDQIRGISIKARNLVVAYIEYRKTKKSILKVRVLGMRFFSDAHIDREDEEWLYIDIDSIHDVIQYAPQLAQTYMSIMKTFSYESFGCCSRYMECSDAKKCIHPNKVKAEACQYKTNLDHGRIFYGKNRNMD